MNWSYTKADCPCHGKQFGLLPDCSDCIWGRSCLEVYHFANEYRMVLPYSFCPTPENVSKITTLVLKYVKVRPPKIQSYPDNLWNIVVFRLQE